MLSSRAMHFVLCASYFAVLGFLAMYGLHRSHLVITCLRYARAIRAKAEIAPLPADAPLESVPHVTVQLPLYNEATVAARLLEHIARMDYPREKLEIQVLDDSTDETRALVRDLVSALREPAGDGVSAQNGARSTPGNSESPESGVRSAQRPPLDIVYIHRVDRAGYKAGALDARTEGRQGRARRGLRRRLPPAARVPPRARPALHERPEGRHGAGALGPPEPRALAPHAHAGPDARRAPPRREPRALRRRLALQLLAAPAACGGRTPSRRAGGWQHDTLDRGPRSLATARSSRAGSSSTARTS